MKNIMINDQMLAEYVLKVQIKKQIYMDESGKTRLLNTREKSGSTKAITTLMIGEMGLQRMLEGIVKKTQYAAQIHAGTLFIRDVVLTCVGSIKGATQALCIPHYFIWIRYVDAAANATNALAEADKRLKDHRLVKMIKRVFGLAYFTGYWLNCWSRPTLAYGQSVGGQAVEKQLQPGLPEACQDWMDNIVRLGVAMGSQLRLRTVETEVHGLLNQTQNLETLLEAEVDMKKVAEAKSVDLAGELESLRAQFSDLQVNNHQLSQQVSTYTIMLSLTMAFKPTYTIID
ncbi:hypothetical protein Tco_1359383 [Tanacetum coccineum]